jgi:ferredoxin
MTVVPEPPHAMEPQVGDGLPSAQRAIDSETGFDVLPGFRRFRQRDDVFNRARWDPSVRSAKAEAFFASYDESPPRVRHVDGFDQRDFALRNASWHAAETLARVRRAEGRYEGFTHSFTMPPKAPRRAELSDVADATRQVKRAARLLGADLVGICVLDERWVYERTYCRADDTEPGVELPPGATHVVVVATEMDERLTATAPVATSSAATGLGYSRTATAVTSLARFLRELGYEAQACMNDTALSVPLAIQAGLGEYGRLGVLIAQEFGPRVRLGKVFTDLPLIPDRPRRFGVREFCEVCRECVSACPPKCLPDGEPSVGGSGPSHHARVRKWTIDAEACFRFWTDLGTDCAACVRACPWNRTLRSPAGRLWRLLAGSPLRRVALWLHRHRRRGRRRAGRWWWGEEPEWPVPPG